MLDLSEFASALIWPIFMDSRPSQNELGCENIDLRETEMGYFNQVKRTSNTE